MYWVLTHGAEVLPYPEKVDYAEMTEEELMKVNETNQLVYMHQGIKNFSERQKYEALITRAQVYATVNRISDILDSHPELSGVDVDVIIQKELTDAQQNLQSTKLIQAQRLMEERLFEDARKKLDEIAHSKGLDRTYARRALFLIGECDRQSGELRRMTKTSRNVMTVPSSFTKERQMNMPIRTKESPQTCGRRSASESWQRRAGAAALPKSGSTRLKTWKIFETSG
ncbi:MAG: hypothetical protein R3C11_15410 [Planctomycetaceae bacterium]